MDSKEAGRKQEVEAGDDDDYDPHLYRQVEKPTTNFETLVHLVKGCVGTGILAMPQAFSFAGLWLAFVSTILIGMIITYSIHVLVKAQYVLCKRYKIPLLTYPQSMKLALEVGPKWLRPMAKYSPIIVDIFLVFYQIGVCCVYILFVCDNIKNVVDNVAEIRIEYYLLIAFIPFLLIVCVRNLKLLAPFSILANIISFISFGMACYFVFQDFPNLVTRDAVGEAYTYPLFFGTTLFAIAAVGVIVALENNMKTPKGFGGYFGVLNIGMTFVVFLYVGMGFFGYWKYGELSEPSITLNLPELDKMAQSIRILYSIAIYISYGLQAQVGIVILWEDYIMKCLKNSKHLLLWEYFLRFCVVFLTTGMAMSIPLLGLFISLFGSFCLSALGIVFPAIIDTCVKWPDGLGKYKWILIKNILLIIFGIVGLFSGTYSAISEMVVKFKAGQVH